MSRCELLPDDVVKAVSDIVGKRNVTTDLIDRISYSKSCSVDESGVPACIVTPRSADEVSRILKIANNNEIPIFVWGRGTAFVPLSVPENCILLDMANMNKMLKVDEETMSVTVDAGVVWAAVNSILRKRGFELPVQGGGALVSCTVGGSIASSAVPHGITGGGTTGDSVLNLEVVLPSGETLWTGSAANPSGTPFERYCFGPDLTGLFIGSCGAFGVITKATLKIEKIPDEEDFACYSFKDYEHAYKAALEIQKNRLARFLVLVQGSLPVKAEALMHIIVTSKEGETAKLLEEIRTICLAYGGVEEDTTGTRNYWRSHNVMYSWLRWEDPKEYYRRGDIPVFCPEASGFLTFSGLLKLTKLFWEYWSKLKNSKYSPILKGFDIYYSRNGGYLWIDILFSLLDPGALDFGLKVRSTLYEMLLSCGGAPATIGGGEHAKKIMSRLGAYYRVLKLIKRSLDPKNILNPGALGL